MVSNASVNPGISVVCVSSFLHIDDDELWSRISEKRKERLGNSSLWLKTTPPRSVYKVRFDLGSKFPVRVGTAEENETNNGDWQDRNDDTKTDFAEVGTYRQLESFVKERNSFIRGAGKRGNTDPRLISSSDSAAENQNQRNLQRDRGARHRFVTLSKANTLHMRNGSRREETPKHHSGASCEECRRIIKERDRFWGLESDSEGDDGIHTFGKQTGRRSSRKDPTTRRFGDTFTERFSLLPGNSRAVSKGKPSKLGRGTWATPVYVPPWQSRSSYRRRSIKPVRTLFDLERVRFGPKKGMFEISSVVAVCLTVFLCSNAHN